MDRNLSEEQKAFDNAPSLSARRAWIEIAPRWRVSGRAFVALRKESVDRNLPFGRLNMLISLSLSARRAWIEMDGVVSGSADYVGRSPQGERG